MAEKFDCYEIKHEGSASDGFGGSTDSVSTG